MRAYGAETFGTATKATSPGCVLLTSCAQCSKLPMSLDKLLITYNFDALPPRKR